MECGLVAGEVSALTAEVPLSKEPKPSTREELHFPSGIYKGDRNLISKMYNKPIIITAVPYGYMQGRAQVLAIVARATARFPFLADLPLWREREVFFSFCCGRINMISPQLVL